MLQSIVKTVFSLDLGGMWIPTLSIIEKIIRPLIIYLFLIIALRVTGKREMSQINTFDFIVLLMLSNVIQNSIIGNDNSITGGIIGALSLLATKYIVEKILYRNRKIENFVVGKSEYLVWNGRSNRKALENNLISEKDLLMAAHKQGISSLDEVDRAELDPNGEILFITKKQNKENENYTEILKQIEKLSCKLESLKVSIDNKDENDT